MHLLVLALDALLACSTWSQAGFTPMLRSDHKKIEKRECACYLIYTQSSIDWITTWLYYIQSCSITDPAIRHGWVTVQLPTHINHIPLETTTMSPSSWDCEMWRYNWGLELVLLIRIALVSMGFAQACPNHNSYCIAQINIKWFFLWTSECVCMHL